MIIKMGGSLIGTSKLSITHIKSSAIISLENNNGGIIQYVYRPGLRNRRTVDLTLSADFVTTPHHPLTPL
ncbi:hypothetical protein PsB1_1296 [Candidatus Phycosocius spiralis]|uniref:Uncharacterized protein n=1 Tax=Candidatus Phycosocius spiralis TaxID=2815099 RepID=A0ABQ4PVT7_9PROT|nr:hypothetical protein PsB1_1296 [Candidatus Phycosocius spiralis]